MGLSFDDGAMCKYSYVGPLGSVTFLSEAWGKDMLEMEIWVAVMRYEDWAFT